MRSFALFAVLLSACDCGQSGPGPGLPDVEIDGLEDVIVDGVADVPGDAIEDSAGDAGDVVDEDPVSLPGSPFRCETSGGAALSSENYSVDLFIGPVRPLGLMSSDNYEIKLGTRGHEEPVTPRLDGERG